MLRLLAVSGIAALASLAGCSGWNPRSQVAFAVVPPVDETLLTYRVHSLRGDWTREFLVNRGAFAELRTIAGRQYALGVLGGHTWMRVGGRAPVEVDGDLAADERREAAWIGMRFADPEPGGRMEPESCGKEVCTFVYTPRDGHALWVDVDRGTRRPRSFDWVTQNDAVESCDDITWSERDGVLAVASATCSAIVNERGRETTTWTLEDRTEEPLAPEWARVEPEEIVPLRELREPARFAIEDPSMRVLVPVEAGGSDRAQLVLDTGSPVTVLSRRFIDALGVVPSPDPPMHVHPPWLPEDTYDTAIVDRLVMGDLELHGVPVLVPRDGTPFDSDEAGLLGMDVMRRFVVDVDGPASELRIWARDRFPAGDDSFTDIPFWGSSHRRVVVGGDVDEIGAIPMILDTGAPLNIVVGGPSMHAAHPRSRDDDAVLREDGSAADYAAEVDGFHLGPFGFPRTPVYAHERVPDLSFLDDDSALVGLGVMRHFRLAFDSARGIVHAAPGPSYFVLARLGIEIDERAGQPIVARIVDGERSWEQPLRVGDVVRRVNGRAVHTRSEALSAIAASRGVVRLTVERHGNRITRNLSLD